MKSPEYYRSELHKNKSRIIKDLRNAKCGYTYDEFINYCCSALITKQSLLSCNPESVLGAFLHCAGMGLLPNTPFNHITIKPYFRNEKDDKSGEWIRIKEARLLMGYQGWVEIILRNTNVINLDTQLVHKSDIFKEIRGLMPNIDHIPDPERQDTTRIAAYAVAWFKDAAVPTFTVVYKEEIDQIKKISKQADPDTYIWDHEEKDPFGWMWKKTAIKQLAKLLPKSKFLDQTINLDNLVNIGVGSVYLTTGGELKFIDSQKAKINEKKSRRKEKSQKVVDGLLFRREKNLTDKA